MGVSMVREKPQTAPLDGELTRLTALRRLSILDTPPEPQFDRVVTLASRFLHAPISLVSLLDSERLWFKARYGSPVHQVPRSESFCEYAIRQPDQVMVVPDARRDERFQRHPAVIAGPKVRAYAGAPLVDSKGQAVGTLCVLDPRPRDFTPEEQSTLADLAAIVVDELHLRVVNNELTRLAQTDPLTGAHNRRSFFAQAARDMARQRRQRQPLAVLVLDIDHFKDVNDRYGHDVGDLVLMHLASSIGRDIRLTDSFARIGGEEFALLLENTGPTVALEVAERIRAMVEGMVIGAAGGALSVTISIGVAMINWDETDISPALRRADMALYAAKRAGRNQVQAAD